MFFLHFGRGAFPNGNYVFCSLVMNDKVTHHTSISLLRDARNSKTSICIIVGQLHHFLQAILQRRLISTKWWNQKRIETTKELQWSERKSQFSCSSCGSLVTILFVSIVFPSFFPHCPHLNRFEWAERIVIGHKTAFQFPSVFGSGIPKSSKF